jgi:hypothetical protein
MNNFCKKISFLFIKIWITFINESFKLFFIDSFSLFKLFEIILKILFVISSLISKFGKIIIINWIISLIIKFLSKLLLLLLLLKLNLFSNKSKNAFNNSMLLNSFEIFVCSLLIYSNVNEIILILFNM